MSVKFVMLDANILISAFDTGADRTDEQRSIAIELIKNFSENANVKFVTTPLIRYEVLCGIKDEALFNDMKAIIDGFKIFDFRNEESDSAITVFKQLGKRVNQLRNIQEPRKYKFDILHLATAKLHGLDIKSQDENLTTAFNFLINNN